MLSIQCIMRFISIARTFARDNNDVIEIIPLIIINVGIFWLFPTILFNYYSSIVQKFIHKN